MADEPSVSWRGRIRRWRWWLIAVALIIAIRVALPIVLRRVIASQASEALHARVDVGGVSLALWKGGVALEDVAVRPADAPPAPPAAPQANAPSFPDNAPIVAFKRFAVELRYLPLFSKTIQLRNIELESPRVALDRLASGDLNVMALVPESEVAVQAGATPGASPEAPTATPTGAAAAPASPWKLGLDRFVLRDGRLRFRDLKLQGSEPVEVAIEEIMVKEVALSPGLYGEPAHLQVKLGLDEGVINVDARLQLLEKGMAVTCDLNADNLPLRRARLYVPKVGWSDLKGELDLALTYELQTDTKNQLHGTFALHNVAVAVPKLQDVAVGWKTLSVGIESVDLLAQRAAVSEVALDGAKLYVRAQGDQPLPVLAESAPAPSPDTTPQPTPAASPAAAAEEKPTEEKSAEPAKPWDWRVASVRVTDSTIDILSDQPVVSVGLDLTATNIAAAAESIAHVALALALGASAMKLDGDLRIASPAFGGTLQITDLALPPLIAVSGKVDPNVLPSATFNANLNLQAGLPAASGATAEPDLLRVAGTLGLRDTRLSPPGQSGLTAEMKGIDLTITELAVPGVIPVGHPAAPGATVRLAANLALQEPLLTRSGDQTLTAGAQSIGLALTDVQVPAALAGLGPADAAPPIHAGAKLDLGAPRVVLGDGKQFSFAAKSISVPLTDVTVPAAAGGAAVQPVRANFGDIRIDGPALRVTRTKDGIVLPGSGPGAPAAQASPAANPTPVPAAAPAPPAESHPPEVTVASLRISGGAVDFTDQAVKPVFQTRFAPIELDARNVRFPNPSVKPLRLEITSAEQGHITLSGDIGPQGGALDFAMKDFALTPFSPYATTYSPYGIDDGALEIKTTAKFSGGKYDVANAVTLHQFDLSGTEGDSLFEQQFGIPLTMALALLRDTSGDIDLNFPIQVDQSGGTTIDLLSVVRSALRQAMMGAIESPLKLVGGVIGVGGKSGAVAPAPIAFPLGHGEPSGPGAENAQRLGDFLAARPAMAVELDAFVTTDDVRWLREQALHSEWHDENFVQRALAFLTQRGPRERIGEYLAARAGGDNPELSAEDAATLQQMLDQRPAPTPDQLRALAAARLAAVDSVLHDKGIDAARITHNDASGEPVDGAAVVKIKFRPLKAPAQARPDHPATPEEGS